MMCDRFQKQRRSIANFQKRYSSQAPGVKNQLASENSDSGLKIFCNFSVEYFLNFYNVTFVIHNFLTNLFCPHQQEFIDSPLRLTV